MLFEQSDKPIVLFDAQCRLCNHWVQFLLRVDKHGYFKLCSVQSPQGQALLRRCGFPVDRYETMLVIHGYKWFVRSDAFIDVMRHLPMPWSVLSGLRWLPKAWRDAGYDCIARNRYRLFGRYDQCLLPSDDHRERFLD